MTEFTSLALILLALLAAPNVRCSSEKTFILYFQEIKGGPNSNFIDVAGSPGRPRSISDFGTLLVYDVPVTERINSDSPLVGRAQGIDVVASINGTQVFSSFSIYFSNGKYSGSTIELQGIVTAVQSIFEGEISVNSGTKEFRHATGYAKLKTVRINPATNSSVLQAIITIKYDR